MGVLSAQKIPVERKDSLHIGDYANAFACQWTDAMAGADQDKVRTDLTPAHDLRFGQGWVDLGADKVGGCRGIGPDHIRRPVENFRLAYRNRAQEGPGETIRARQ
jgi:S-methylmethionine-dependent homocysteine/selenocysteine methylase